MPAAPLGRRQWSQTRNSAPALQGGGIVPGYDGPIDSGCLVTVSTAAPLNSP